MLWVRRGISFGRIMCHYKKANKSKNNLIISFKKIFFHVKLLFYFLGKDTYVDNFKKAKTLSKNTLLKRVHS